MSTKRKGDIKSRRLTEEVELFGCDEKVFDGFTWITRPKSFGLFPADVEQIKGSRFAYYQSLGFSHPMIITMRDPEIEFSTLKYNGQDVVVKNKTSDPNNLNYIVITGDYTNGKV